MPYPLFSAVFSPISGTFTSDPLFLAHWVLTLLLSLPPGTSLVQVLIQLGPDITSDPELVRALLERFGITEQNPPREAQVIEIISTLGRLAVEGTPLCDVGALIRTLASFVSVGVIHHVGFI